MGFQRVPLTAEVKLLYRASGSIDMQSAFYFRDEVAVRDTDYLEDLGDAVAVWYGTDIRPLQHSGISLTEIVVTDLDQEFGASAAIPVNLAGTRADTTGRAPYQAPALVQWRCDPGSPPRKGWTFHMGAVDGDYGENAVAAGFQTSLVAAYNALRGDVSGTPGLGTSAQVIVSRFHTVGGVSVLRDPAETNTIATVTARQLLGAQRDRRS